MDAIKKIILIIVFFFCATTYAHAWKFVVWSDPHFYHTLTAANIASPYVAPAIIADNPDFVILTGDIVTGYTATYQGMPYKTLYAQLVDNAFPTLQLLLNAGIEIYPLRGNHDACSGGCNNSNFGVEDTAGWVKAWTQFLSIPSTGSDHDKYLTYKVSHENSDFFILDEFYDGVIPPCNPLYQVGVDEKWLEESLSESVATHKFIFGHQPFFPVCNGADALRIDFTQHLVKRDRIWGLFADYNVDAYFCGHYHTFSVRDITKTAENPVYQIMAGTTLNLDLSATYSYPYTGGLASPWTSTNIVEYHGGGGAFLGLGYTLVEVDGDNVTITFKKATYSAPNWSFGAIGIDMTYDKSER